VWLAATCLALASSAFAEPASPVLADALEAAAAFHAVQPVVAPTGLDAEAELAYIIEHGQAEDRLRRAEAALEEAAEVADPTVRAVALLELGRLYHG
jgi:hypothetical protein